MMFAKMTSGSPMWIKGLLALVAMVFAALAALSMLGRQATTRWEEFAASLRARGQPLTFEEIEAQREPIPDEQNSALLFADLEEPLERLGKAGPYLDALVFNSRKVGGDFFDGVSRRRIEASRKLAASFDDVRAALEELRDKPIGRFDIEYNKDNPILTLLPHVTRLRAASKFVRMDAMVRLANGDLPGAVDDFELQCRLAGTLHDEPILISRLVQVAIQAQACHSVEEILRVGEVDDESLEVMELELRNLRDDGTIRWGLLGERAFFIETCEALAEGRVVLPEVETSISNADEAIPLRNFLRLPVFLVRSNELRGAEMHTWLIDAADDPAAMRAAAARIDAELPKLARWEVLVKIMMPSLSRSVVLQTRIAAELECALAGVAAERFRLQEGRLPDSLEELVPEYLAETLIDPFDGNPVRFVKTEDGIVIYSIDEDQADDGGDVGYRPPTKNRKKAPDVGFRLFRPERRGVLIVEDPPGEED